MSNRRRNKRNNNSNKIESLFSNISFEYKPLIYAILTIFGLIFIMIILLNGRNKTNVQNEEITDTVIEGNNYFSVDNIYLYTSAYSENASNNEIWNLNVHTFTDICVKINNHTENLDDAHAVKSLEINNLASDCTNKEGTRNFYYKSLYNLGLFETSDENLITNSLKYDIITIEDMDYDVPQMYANCSTPLIFSFVHTNFKTNFITMNPIIYQNGKLLSLINYDIDNLKTVITFKIKITNMLDEVFVADIYIDVPYKDENFSIKNGYFAQNITYENPIYFKKIK